ncbi:vacuolar sorting protein 9 (vps9) domain-containing protein [Cardiosporidium cionae]|uniref:Vacuolar sorting protein 9 (Vps9) domain-containing protein n=1 Tax=Cardiosporidium cionae TaxID=476202 RepID=A0ABQ7JCH7_9APIC|nr:vacuolar sorting protein 9 (vps9) domain-containing protein [Cardiosporidium cionae]|eukprot:KAF8821738.1 vacuolar sorting protein 9 (vps9) domain-containing protein [Cardiosporidium cionae]
MAVSGDEWQVKHRGDEVGEVKEDGIASLLEELPVIPAVWKNGSAQSKMLLPSNEKECSSHSLIAKNGKLLTTENQAMTPSLSLLIQSEHPTTMASHGMTAPSTLPDNSLSPRDTLCPFEEQQVLASSLSKETNGSSIEKRVEKIEGESQVSTFAEVNSRNIGVTNLLTLQSSDIFSEDLPSQGSHGDTGINSLPLKNLGEEKTANVVKEDISLFFEPPETHSMPEISVSSVSPSDKRFSFEAFRATVAGVLHPSSVSSTSDELSSSDSISASASLQKHPNVSTDLPLSKLSLKESNELASVVMSHVDFVSSPSMNTAEKSGSPFRFLKNVPQLGWYFGKKINEDAGGSMPALKSESVSADGFPMTEADFSHIASVLSSASHLSSQIETMVQESKAFKLEEGKSESSGKGSSESYSEQNYSVATQKPRTPYNDFLEKLKHSSCTAVVAHIKKFVEAFQINDTREQVANHLHRFIAMTKKVLLQAENFSDDSEDAHSQLLDDLEKFLTQKLFFQSVGILSTVLFQCNPHDETEDYKLHDKITCLQWIEPKHLEIGISLDNETFQRAGQELLRIDKMKSPKDKLILILNCCRTIVTLLENDEAKTITQFASADDILPLLIFLIIQTNPPRLHSNIQFIQAFRYPQRHIEEEAYFFTQYSSAVCFIRGLGETTHLNIAEEEFKRRFYATEVSLLELHTPPRSLPPVESSTPSHEKEEKNVSVEPPTLSSGEEAIEMQRLSKILVQKAKETKTRFDHMQSIDEFTVGNLQELLSEYHSLVSLKEFVLSQCSEEI